MILYGTACDVPGITSMALHGIARHTCLMMMVTRLVPWLIPTIPTIPVPYHQGRDDDSDTEEDADE